MKPPICSLCKRAHWSYEPHIWGDAKEIAAVSTQASKPGPTPPVITEPEPVITGYDPLLRGMTDEEFATAYRPWRTEFMRRWRAKAKD